MSFPDIGADVLDVVDNISEISEKEWWVSKIKDKCLNFTKSFTDKLRDTYNYTFYKFNQDTLDMLINNMENPNRASLNCKSNPNDFIVLNCDESNILLTFLNLMDNKKELNLRDLKKLKNYVSETIKYLSKNEYKFNLILKLLQYNIKNPNFIEKNLYLLNYTLVLSAMMYSFKGVKESISEKPEDTSNLDIKFIIPVVSAFTTMLLKIN